MKTLESNLFPIRNLEALSFRYRFRKIRGLDRALDALYANRTQLQGLAMRLQCPVTVVDRRGSPFLVLPEDREPPSEVRLVGTVATFEPGESVELDFTKPHPDLLDVALNVLRFHVEGSLRGKRHLWQPRAGDAFLRRRPHGRERGVCHYLGFRVRPAYVSEFGFGLCVDLTSRFVRERPLPARVDRDSFERYRNRHAIYHFGDNWFEIQLVDLADQAADEFRINLNAKSQLLLDFIIDNVPKPIPPEVQQVPADASVVFYRNTRGEQRAVPTPLCFEVIDTAEAGAMGFHRLSIAAPHVRDGEIRRFVADDLHELAIAGTTVGVDGPGWEVPVREYQVPDLRFGNGHVLSVRRTEGATPIDLSRLGQARLDRLQDPRAGFFDNRPLDRQYVVIPKSIWEGPGRRFLADLAREVNALFPHGSAWEPAVVPYDDSGRRNVARQGQALLQAMQQSCPNPGYALVMIHRVGRGDDELAAFAHRAIAERHDVRVSVIHTDTVATSYESDLSASGARVYRPRADRRGRLAGYLRNVAISKVLLANRRWPFVLASPLNADVVIGLDVKNHTCGLLAVARTCEHIVDVVDTSRQREQLREDQTATLVERVLRKIVPYQVDPQHIVIQRDGRSWPTEIRGARRALQRLSSEGLLAPSAELTVVEILKTSRVPVRLFEISRRSAERSWIENPEIGSAFFAGERDGYVCTTGRAFRRPGTVRPLHVRWVEGALPLPECLEDVYALSALAWTRPEDCSRDPITIRLLDRILEEAGGEFDADGIRYSEYDGEGE